MAEITTTKGLMEESLLRRVDGELDNDNEHTTWTEYYDGGDLVHRSAHITLKKGLQVEAVGGQFG